MPGTIAYPPFFGLSAIDIEANPLGLGGEVSAYDGREQVENHVIEQHEDG
jgi:hypothetical protein